MRKKFRANKRRAGIRYNICKWVVDVLLNKQYHIKRMPVRAKEEVK